jgi:carbon monoxide dehydrogenase subunit G
VQIQGEHLIHASRDHVWHLLNDPAVLARITPGVTSLVPDGDDRYKATITVALGPVKGAFQGLIEVTDKRPPEAMTLKLQVRGPGGGMAAIGRLTLHEAETGTHATRVEWSGEPQLMGLLATVGGRLVQGTAKTQADQFFTQLERELVRPDGVGPT